MANKIYNWLNKTHYSKCLRLIKKYDEPRLSLPSVRSFSDKQFMSITIKMHF